jgi:probable Rubsico expression protein CbbX
MEWVRARRVQSRRRRLAQRAGSVQGGDRHGERGPAPQRGSGRPRRGKPGAVMLPASATVKFAAERAEADIDAVFASLDADLVGLMPVKQKVQEIAALLLVDRARQKFGLTAPRPNLHMCFTGPPGTGKTTVALRIAELLHRLGYLERGHLVHAMRDDLVGEYIGQTAPKTKRVLDRALGGVLFIDEAYYLYRASDSKDYGQEAIDILLQVMENDRDKLVVILAGYEDRMDEFFGSNPGMSSRIAHHLDFAAYGLDDLTAIGKAHAGPGPLLPLARRRAGLPPLPHRRNGPAPVRQRPQCPQRTRTRPPRPCSPPRLRPAPPVDPRRPHAPRAQRHPHHLAGAGNRVTRS